MKRVGIDIGGTFTDLIVYDGETKRLSKSKTLTTPLAPEEGFLQACRDQGFKMDEVSHFLHATTLVTNLLIQRGGNDVGLVTTKGFRHVLEVGDGRRAETYSLQWERPQPFAPTHLVVEVDERVNAKGVIVTPLNRAAAKAVIRPLLAKGVKSIAVSLFHAYANGEHEREIADIINELAPDIHVSLSSVIDPRIREFQRTSTTVLNAYAMPRVYHYVERLDKSLGLERALHYMHSGGGIISSTVAQRHPVMLVASGPAAGVLAGTFLGKKMRVPNIITADMGGTSFDVCVIRDGMPEINDTLEVEPTIPLRIDSIDVVSVGAGGGSIAWVDQGNALKVGPQSSASKLGPACYDRGGRDPTVTDANMALGLLNPEALLGGRLKLAPEKSHQALQPLASHFGLSVAEVAKGIYRIVNASMAQATRRVTVNKGIDPREFALVSFGGAGGQHAIEVARELGIRNVVFPANASVLSAFGLLTADLKYTATKSLWQRLKDISAADLNGHFSALRATATSAIRGSDSQNIEKIRTEPSADVRYVGQSYDLRVPIHEGVVDPAKIYDSFEKLYRKRYGVALGDAVEITNIHVTATGEIEPLELPRTKESRSRRRPKARRQRFVALVGKKIPVYDRIDLKFGMQFSGPCIVEEVDTTIVIPAQCRSEIDEYGNIRTNIGSVKALELNRRKVDPFTAEILRSYLTSTVDEMVKTTTGAAYSTCFAEGGDFTCAIFDAKGRMVAQALGIPIHAGSLFDGMKTIVSSFSGFSQGDVILMNDPYQGGSHQPDAIVARPIFVKGKLVAFAVNRGHWTDIGGMAAAGWTGSATHVVQEALIIPPVKLYRRGKLDQQIRNFILKNVRLPKQLWGDIQSQVASNITAERRIKDLVDRYGLSLVLGAMENAIEYSRAHMRRMLTEIPNGKGSATDVLEDDGFNQNRQYRVQVAVEKKKDKLIVDCSGTDAQAIGPINMSIASSKGSIYASLLSLIDPALPLNESIVDFVDMRLPEGTLVNPRYPAPVSSYFHIMTRVAENVIRAFDTIKPELVVAGSYGDAQNVSGWGFNPDSGEEFIWYLFQCGGTGGRATKDGNTGIRHVLSNARSESMEVWERRYPLFFMAYEVVQDSAGSGKFRGGFGQRRVMRLETDTLITANTDRMVVPPVGVFGGAPGSLNKLAVVRGGVRKSFQEMFGFPSASKFSNARLKQGDILICELGGGGGFGSVLDRDPKKTEWDVLNGWLSPQKAKADYGICVDSATGNSDASGTKQAGAQIAARSEKVPEY